MSEEQLTYMIAISESTPGPIMVNLATYIGSDVGGLLGSILATLTVILPAFILLLLIAAVMKTAIKNKYVQAVLSGLKPCIAGIILATGLHMVISHCRVGSSFDLRSGIITGILVAILLLYPKLRGKKFPPIALIGCAALCGILVYGI
jgi:chromate transporter